MPNVYGDTPEEIEAAKLKEDQRRRNEYQRKRQAYISSLLAWQEGGEGEKPNPPPMWKPVPR